MVFSVDYNVSMDFEWICRVHKADYKGYYWGKNPVVLMDGTGITSTREYLAIWEAFQALKSHHLLNMENLCGLFVRISFYLVRKGMEKVGMAGFLKQLKKKKYFFLYHQDY